MRLSQIGELSLLEIIRKRFKGSATRLILGIGDDSAVVRPRDAKILYTTDMMVEDVHFDFKWMTPYQLGFKLVSVNVSDIYAMGGRPEFLLLDIAAPKDTDFNTVSRILEGAGRAMEIHRTCLIGGDISSSGRIFLSATVTGYSSRIITRKGARPGDFIYVTGAPGDSACGLELLKRTGRPVEIEKRKKIEMPLKWDIALPLIRRHLMPSVSYPAQFVRSATSMIDISDGLLVDLSRICTASHAGAEIYADSIPLSGRLRKASGVLGISAMDLALGGGEDYELLFTAPKKAKINAVCIGKIVKSGMKLVYKNGTSKKITSMGYRHFEA